MRCENQSMSTYYTELFISKEQGKSMFSDRSYTYQSDPQKIVLINETVEVLVQKQQRWSGEGQVVTLHFTLCHMSNLENKADVTVVTFTLTDANAVWVWQMSNYRQQCLEFISKYAENLPTTLCLHACHNTSYQL